MYKLTLFPFIFLFTSCASMHHMYVGDYKLTIAHCIELTKIRLDIPEDEDTANESQPATWNNYENKM